MPILISPEKISPDLSNSGLPGHYCNEPQTYTTMDNAIKYQQSATAYRVRTIAYWLVTGFLAFELAYGSTWDLRQIPYVREVMTQLGYPAYILLIIGVWKLPGAVVLLIPGTPRLKEWAYAGTFFIFSSAFVSHLAVGDVKGSIWPAIFGSLTVASWFLRPASRRIMPVAAAPAAQPAKWKSISYWATIVILGFVLLSGGAGEMLHLWGTVEGTVDHLGYPLYFLTILGIWKILAGITLIVPRFQLLKEWAYAGIVFNLTGAVASHIAIGDGIGHFIAPLIFAAVAMFSWWLLPANRRLQ
jgi:hypothetical protein